MVRGSAMKFPADGGKARCYARTGGACESRLRFKTNSANVGESGGGPVSCAGVPSATCAWAKIASTSAKTGKNAKTTACGTFASSGTVTFSVLQQPCGICGHGALPSTGFGLFLQQLDSALVVGEDV